MVHAAAQFIVWASGRLNALALWGAVAAVSVMVLAIMYQVVARYIFASPPIWTEELARYAMVWAGLLGASCAFHASADPTLFPAAKALRGPKGLIAAIVRFCAVATFAAPVVWFCFIGPSGGFKRGFIARSLARSAEMLGFPMIWITLAIPIGLTLVLVHAFAGIAAQALPKTDED